MKIWQTNYSCPWCPLYRSSSTGVQMRRQNIYCIIGINLFEGLGVYRLMRHFYIGFLYSFEILWEWKIYSFPQSAGRNMFSTTAVWKCRKVLMNVAILLPQWFKRIIFLCRILRKNTHVCQLKKAGASPTSMFGKAGISLPSTHAWEYCTVIGPNLKVPYIIQSLL